MKNLSKQEFVRLNHNLCNFEHIFEDQTECMECGVSINGNFNCPNVEEAWDKYKESKASNDALFILQSIK